MTTFSLYCPACGTASQAEPDTYELAPGTETVQCPACLTRFIVEVEFIPLAKAIELRQYAEKHLEEHLKMAEGHAADSFSDPCIGPDAVEALTYSEAHSSRVAEE